MFYTLISLTCMSVIALQMEAAEVTVEMLYVYHQKHLIKRRCANLGVQGRGRLLNEIFNPVIQSSKVNSKKLGREKNARGKAG